MKHLLTLTIVAILFASCSVDEEKKFDKTDLYGTWEQINPDPADDGLSAIYHEFTYNIYESSSVPINVSDNYSFYYDWNEDGEVSWENLLGMTVKLEIQTLNSNTLSFRKYKGGIFDDEYTCTKIN